MRDLIIPIETNQQLSLAFLAIKNCQFRYIDVLLTKKTFNIFINKNTRRPHQPKLKYFFGQIGNVGANEI